MQAPESNCLGCNLSYASSVQFSSVAQSCLTLCIPMDCSLPGLLVHHQLPESTQTHVYWVGDAIHPTISSSVVPTSSRLQTSPASDQIRSDQLLSRVELFVTPWTMARQASLPITNSQSLLKLMSIESVMASTPLIFCCPLLLPPSIFPSIRVFSNKSVLRIRWPKFQVDVILFPLTLSLH